MFPTCPGSKCEAGDLNAGSSFAFFNFTYDQDSGKGHISGTADLFNIGTQYGTILVDQDVLVRFLFSDFC